MEKDSYDIVFGYDAKTTADKMKVFFENQNIRFSSCICASKLAIVRKLASRQKCDALVLFEIMPTGAFSAEDLVWLHEEFNVQIIPLLMPEHKNDLEYLKTLYYGGILTGVFVTQDMIQQLPETLVSLIINGRSRETAKSYYGLSGKVI